MTYKELLQKGQDAIDAIKLPHKVKKAEKNLEVFIIDLESDIASLEVELLELKSADPLDMTKIIDKTYELKTKEKDLVIVKEVQSELFGSK